MAIFLFAVSVLFVVWVARRKKIPALSPYGIFAAFQILYNVLPWFVSSLGINNPIYSLLSDSHVINIQLQLAAISNLCFGLIHLCFSRNVRLGDPTLPSSKSNRTNYLLLTFPLFILTCVLCEKYGWHQYTFANYDTGGEGLGGMFTVTAYAKFSFVAVYLYYLYRFGLDKGAWILLLEHVIVMVIDGARATFLPILLLTLFILLGKIDANKTKRIYVLAILGITASIGTRALILKSGDWLQDMIIPVTVEGTMGDYATLQSIYAVEHLFRPPYSAGASYVIDPLAWLIPQSMGRKRFTFADRWGNEIDPILRERFNPMGGFYFLSESITAFSYLGPAIVTTTFAGFLVWFERNKNRHRMLYLAWMPTLGIQFIKTPFGNCFKLFAVQIICLAAFRFLAEIKTQLPNRASQKLALQS